MSTPLFTWLATVALVAVIAIVHQIHLHGHSLSHKYAEIERHPHQQRQLRKIILR